MIQPSFKPHTLQLLIVVTLMQTLVYFATLYIQEYNVKNADLKCIIAYCEDFLAKNKMDSCEMDGYAAAVLDAYLIASKSFEDFVKLQNIIAKFGGNKIV